MPRGGCGTARGKGMPSCAGSVRHGRTEPAGGREGSPQQRGDAADDIARFGRKQAPLGNLLVFGKYEPRKRVKVSVLDGSRQFRTREGKTFQPTVLVITALSSRLQITAHGLPAERVRDIPPATVVRAEAGNGMDLTDAEVRQALRADRSQGVEARVQHPARAAARGKDEVRPQGRAHETGEEPPAVIFPLVSLHRGSKGCAVVSLPETDGS